VTLAKQLALAPVPTRTHVPVNVPVLLLENATVPVGVVAPVLLVSVTVAVQLVELLTITVAGVQFTIVVVGSPV
jgi:hypothetical protein